jgi:acyl carrier protein
LAETLSGIQEKIRTFIVSNFLFSRAKETLQNNTSFLESGIVDSTGILEVINFLQEEFAVVVLDEEMLPENLDSLNNITGYVGRKLGCV